MSAFVIRGAQVYHRGRFQPLEVRVDGAHISAVAATVSADGAAVIEASGLHLFPGVIDVQVHFREPGNEHKEDLASGSRACARGGVTSFLEMPNTYPPAINQEGIDLKLALAAKKSRVNYGFFIGATGENIADLQSAKRVCGIKIFMGASTGTLLVDDPVKQEAIFAETDPRRVIALHCEDEARINQRTKLLAGRADVRSHTEVRDVETAWLATKLAVRFGRKHKHRTHILHVSSARECDLFRPRDPYISAETSPHHLLMNVRDYARLGTLAKMNPPIKYEADNRGLWRALHDGRVAAIATDHAPHLLSEKRGDHWKAPAGIPAIENSLSLILDAASRGLCDLGQVVRWMCEAPAELYRMKRKGRIEPGFDADLTLVDTQLVEEVRNEEQLTRCGWSPWHGQKLKGRAVRTIVMGQTVYADGKVHDDVRGNEIEYEV